ncbi:MAG: hypothetical protein K8T90_07965 [Planctomycetes bacterium]|nr:hypothetical protein [Planctomycetota bacterium]
MTSATYKVVLDGTQRHKGGVARGVGVLDLEFVTAAWTRWAREVLDEVDPMGLRADASSVTTWRLVDSWSRRSAAEASGGALSA